MNAPAKPSSSANTECVSILSSVGSLIVSLPASSYRSLILAQLRQITAKVAGDFSVAVIPLSLEGCETASQLLRALQTYSRVTDQTAQIPVRVGVVSTASNCVALSDLISDPIALGSFLNELDLLVMSGTLDVTCEPSLIEQARSLARGYRPIVTLSSVSVTPASIPLCPDDRSTSHSYSQATTLCCDAAALMMMLQDSNLRNQFRNVSASTQIQMLLIALHELLNRELLGLLATSTWISGRLSQLANDMAFRNWQSDALDLRRWTVSELSSIQRGLIGNAKAILDPGSPLGAQIESDLNSITDAQFLCEKVGRQKRISLDTRVCQRQMSELQRSFALIVGRELTLLRDAMTMFVSDFNDRAKRIGGLATMTQFSLPSLSSVMPSQPSTALNPSLSTMIPRTGAAQILFTGRRVVFTAMWIISMLATTLGLRYGGLSRSNQSVGIGILLLLLASIPFIVASSIKSNREAANKAQENLKAQWKRELERLQETILRRYMLSEEEVARFLDSQLQRRLVDCIDTPLRSAEDQVKAKQEDLRSTLRTVDSNKSRVQQSMKSSRDLHQKALELQNRSLNALTLALTKGESRVYADGRN